MDCKIVSYCCYIVVVLGIICQQRQVTGVNFQINPLPAVKEPNSTQLLTFSCSVSEGNVRTVSVLALQKNQSNTDPIQLAQYIPDPNMAIALDFNSEFKNTATTRGFVLQFTGTSATPGFTMSVGRANITCADQGQYICQLDYLTSQSKSAKATGTLNLTINVPPKINALEAYRDRVDGTRVYDGSSKNTAAIFSLGSTVYLKCRADIGTDSNVKVSWRVSSAYNADTFDQYTPPINTYTDGTAVTVNSCEYTRDATLMYNISDIDANRNYGTMLCITCYVSSNLGGSPESSPFCITTASSSGNQEASVATAGSNSGAIAGGVVGGVVFLIVIAVIVYLVWYRRGRSAGETYETKEQYESEYPNMAPPDYEVATEKKSVKGHMQQESKPYKADRYGQHNPAVDVDEDQKEYPNQYGSHHEPEPYTINHMGNSNAIGTGV